MPSDKALNRTSPQIKACKKAAMECDLNTKRAREIATLCAKMAKGD